MPESEYVIGGAVAENTVRWLAGCLAEVLVEAGDAEVAAVLRDVRVEPVLTPHPTEAKRASVLDHMHRLSLLLATAKVPDPGFDGWDEPRRRRFLNHLDRQRRHHPHLLAGHPQRFPAGRQHRRRRRPRDDLTDQPRRGVHQVLAVVNDHQRGAQRQPITRRPPEGGLPAGRRAATSRRR